MLDAPPRAPIAKTASNFVMTRWSAVNVNRGTQSAVTDPIAITFEGPIDDGWRVQRSLRLLFEREVDGWHVISDDVFYQYGHGRTLREALLSYAQSLIDHFEFLEREAATNDLAKPELNLIRSYLHRVTV